MTVMVTGASCEAERLQDLASQIRPLAPAQVSAVYPDLRTSFTDLNRLQAIETCYWLNTPTPDCADQQEVKLVADDLHLRGALYRTGGLVLGVGAIGLLGSALRGLKTP
jgi:hypothetical protein